MWVAAVPRLAVPTAAFALATALPRLDDGIVEYLTFAAALTLGYLVFLGVPLVLLLRRIDRWWRRRHDKPATTGWQRPQTRLKAEFPVGPANLFAAALEAVRSLPGASIRTSDETRGLIKASVATSWTSAGERIEVRIVPASSTSSIAVIKSKPKLPTTVFDAGKNRANVAHIQDALESATRGTQAVERQPE